MKKSVLFISAISAFLLNGCVSIGLTEVIPPNDNYELLLPPLVPSIDIQSLETVFVATQTSTDVLSSSQYLALPNSIETETYATSSTKRNPTINDLSVYFENDVNTNICFSTGARKGYIKCKVVNGEAYLFINYINCFLSGAGGIPALCGLPLGKGVSKLILQVDIYDQNMNPIGRYISKPYEDRRKVGIWRYSEGTAIRKAAIESFKACMNDIKGQIRADYDSLIKKLK